MSLRPARSTLFPYTTLFRSWNAYILLNKGDIFTGSSGQIFKVSNIASCFTFPALQLLVDRFDTIQLLGQRRRSEEHTSELQSRGHLVCRLLLEKIKTN